MIKSILSVMTISLSSLMAADSMNIDQAPMTEQERYLPYMQYEAFKKRYAEHTEAVDRIWRIEYLWGKRHDRSYSDFLFPLLDSAQGGYSISQKAILSLFTIDADKRLGAQSPITPDAPFLLSIHQLAAQYNEMQGFIQILADFPAYNGGFNAPFYGSKSLSDYHISTIRDYVKDISAMLNELKEPGKIISCIIAKRGLTKIPMITLDRLEGTDLVNPSGKLYGAYMATKAQDGKLMLLKPQSNSLISHLYKWNVGKEESFFTFGQLLYKFSEAKRDLLELQKKLSIATTPENFKIGMQMYLAERRLDPNHSYFDDLLSQYKEGRFEFNIDNILQFIEKKMEVIDGFQKLFKNFLIT